MENSGKRSSIRKRLLAAITVCLVAVLLVIPNLFLAAYKNSISAKLNAVSPLPLDVGGIYYLPPNLLIVKKTCFYEADSGSRGKIISVPETYIVFSLPALLLERKFEVISLRCFRPSADGNSLYRLVTGNYRQILEFILSLPLRDMDASLKEGSLFYRKDADPILKLNADSTLRIKDRSFFLNLRAGGVSCDLLGAMDKNNSLDVKKFKVLSRTLDGEFWGKISSSAAALKGFLFINNAGLTGRNDRDNIFILDIDSLVKFGYPLTEIEKLDFTLNNNPVRIKASLGLASPYNSTLEASCAFRGLRNNGNTGTLKNLSLAASFYLKDDKYLFINGTAGIDLPDWRKQTIPLQSARLRLTDMTVPLDKIMPLREFNAAGLELLCRTDGGSCLTKLDGLNVTLRRAEKNAWLAEYSSDFHKGWMEGTARIGWKNDFPVITAFASIKDAEVNELREIVPQFSRIHGKFFGNMMFLNYPRLLFKGGMNIHNGRLEDFSFFKWLAELFALPGLNKIPFRAADADFLVDKDGAGLVRMRLDSDNVGLNGNYRLERAGNMVSSRISLTFPRSLLEESPKFTPLLKLLDKDLSDLKFNFQLSGKMDDTNFQWLQSDFKDQLQKAIPDFAEAGFEEKLQKIIESISKQ